MKTPTIVTSVAGVAVALALTASASAANMNDSYPNGSCPDGHISVASEQFNTAYHWLLGKTSETYSVNLPDGFVGVLVVELDNSAHPHPTKPGKFLPKSFHPHVFGELEGSKLGQIEMPYSETVYTRPSDGDGKGSFTVLKDEKKPTSIKGTLRACAAPTPSETPTETEPTWTPTSSPTDSPTSTPPSPSPTITPTPSETPTPSPSPTPTSTTPTESPTPSPSVTPTESLSPSEEPSQSETSPQTPSPSPTSTTSVPTASSPTQETTTNSFEPTSPTSSTVLESSESFTAREELPRTGRDLGLLVAGMSLLLAAGASIWYFTRRTD